jgi:hypothetical protein
MHRRTRKVEDADHFTESWIMHMNGKEQTPTFHFTRKKVSWDQGSASGKAKPRLASILSEGFGSIADAVRSVRTRSRQE